MVSVRGQRGGRARSSRSAAAAKSVVARALTLLVCTFVCSDQLCSDDVPEECQHIIPYTSYPNRLFGLEDEEDYKNVTDMVMKAVEDYCNDTDTIGWGACNMLFPRCLLGFPLYLCRETCLGEW